MYILIFYLPLISFIICFFGGRKIGYNGSKIISIFLLLLTVIISYLIFYEIINKELTVIVNFFYWFNLGLLSTSFSFLYDKISSSMLILIVSISLLVHIFSIFYMKEDPHLPRFMSYLSLFTFFMVILVISNNLIQLFIGWEGVGLCSYLLINFWYTRIQANKAAIKAVLINKIGDIGLLLSIIFLWKNSGLTLYSSLFSLYTILYLEYYLNFINLLLLIGVIGKSAQIGLHMWLPDAMEGPTPVSALIHAATMVTAGVFLIIRVSPLLEETPLILLFIILLGSITTFVSATISLSQNDLKKVIAYSTCSQLGYMVIISGFSFYNVSLFHLINHGFFKALLFLSAGSIIHSFNDEQDFRRLGNIKEFNPLTYISIIIGSLSLMGLPFLTGFYSKDLLLELIYQKHYFTFALWLGIITAFLSALYSFRLIYYSFLSFPQYNKKSNSKEHWDIFLSLFILLFLSIIIGFILHFYILIDYFPIIILNSYKLLPLIVSILGSFISIYLGLLLIKWWKINFNKKFIIIYSFIIKIWYFDSLINYFITKPVLNYGFKKTYKIIDSQLLEVIGPVYFTNKFIYLFSILSNYHLGKISSYFFGFVFFIFIFFHIIS
uniref:NADH dehydrogenase subunit 5 n=1 Tax=Praya dubia TaxID=316184 RepID=UPI0026E3AD45|nr:NADH dehydrogenase subunit 5 [Praya dubia]WJJ70097.1 NADH dehydrogenase subunit 5 [Praya dubia]